MLIVGLTFVFFAAIILVIYWMFVVRPEDKAARALRLRLTLWLRRPVRTDLTKKAAPLGAEGVRRRAGPTGRLLDPQACARRLGLPWTMGAVLLACGLLGLVVFRRSRSWRHGQHPARCRAHCRVAAVPGSGGPPRSGSSSKQLPQAVEMVAFVARGHALTTGLLMVAEEVPAPLGAEFRLLYDQQTYGKPLPDVLREFADRVPLLDARLFATAVLTQRETGGNLAEVLDKLASVVRERFHVRRQVRALSSHGRITGWTLACLPPVLAVLLALVAPSHVRLLIDDPLGRQLTAGGLGLQIIGMLAIRRIVSIDY